MTRQAAVAHTSAKKGNKRRKNKSYRKEKHPRSPPPKACKQKLPPHDNSDCQQLSKGLQSEDPVDGDKLTTELKCLHLRVLLPAVSTACVLEVALVLTSVPTRPSHVQGSLHWVKELVWADVSSYCYLINLIKIVSRIRTHNTAFLNEGGEARQ